MDKDCVPQNIMKTLLLLYLLALARVHAYSNSVYNDSVQARNPAMRELVSGANDFGLSLLNQIPNSQNAFISPISISMVMGMLYNGARGPTAEELRHVMLFPRQLVHDGFGEILDIIKPIEGVKSGKLDYALEMANAMLVDSAFDILSSYKEDSRKYYEAAAESTSFSLHPQEIVDSVNGWVAWKTKNSILKILEEPLDSLTKLFLMNAVYFKGTWQKRFDQRLTRPDTFYNDGLVPKTVPMMRQKGQFRYGFDHEFQALELPYGEAGDVSMLILLPLTRDGLPKMESELSSSRLSNISNHLRNATVQVTLPRFRFTEDYDLIPLFKKMGMSHIFDPTSADFSGITQAKGLYVTKAVHSCVIDLNEQGTEAAAVTGVSAGVRTGGPVVPHFNAEHPFMFFIMHKRLDLTLFIGRVMKL